MITMIMMKQKVERSMYSVLGSLTGLIIFCGYRSSEKGGFARYVHLGKPDSLIVD